MATKPGRSILRQQYPIRIKGSSRCPSHKDNDVVLLCQDCDILICIRCSITAHKTHIDSFRELTQIKPEQKTTLQKFVNQTDNENIPKLHEEILSTERELSTGLSKYKNIYENIEKQRAQCQQDLDTITADYKATCEKMEMATTNLLQTHIINLEERMITLQKLSSEYKETIHTGNTILLYDSVSEIRQLDSDIPPTPHIDMTEFTLGTDRQIHLKQAMGILKFSDGYIQAAAAMDVHSNQNLVLKPNSSNKLPTAQPFIGTVPYKLLDNPVVISHILYKYGITSISPTSIQNAWLCNIHTNTIKLIKNKKTFFTNKFKVIEEIKHKSDLTDISLDPTTGRLWLCCMDERTIYEISISSTPIEKFTTEDRPASLCVTREGQVMVGTWGTQGYRVVMYTADGRVLHTHIVERSGTGVIQSITQCGVTGNIAVVSSKLISGDGSDPENYRRHIIIYNPTLQPMVHYQGEGIQVGEIPASFDPYTVIYDSKGNIVVADITRNTIELISGAGTYVKTLHTNKGKQGPVGIQMDDVLWSYLMSDKGKWGIKVLKYYSD